ncbi:MAG: hypothetical protein JNL11_19205 [Bdellovibrionaceae bacterium]|nr:hypothetical protein [Pseudobdellovibrionaceae bacterium]
MNQLNQITWMADFEVESHVCLTKENKILKFNDPLGKYCVELRNGSIKLGGPKPSIFASVIFKSNSDGLNADVKLLKREASIYLKEFLATLCLVTKTKLEIINCERIIDWRPGIEMRLIHQFKTFPATDLPEPALSIAHIKSAEFLSDRENSAKLEKAVRWFWRGINSLYFEDQFQCFWFSLEILAAHLKPSEKVPDKCAKCRSPLYCDRCNEIPTHMPYNKQAIEHILRQPRHGSPNEVTIQQLFEIRNRLMHGDFIEEIEKSLNIKMQFMIDNLGNFVWSVIVSTLKIETKAGEDSLELLQPSTLAHGEVIFSVKGEIGTPVGGDIQNPDPSQYMGIQLEMEILEPK